MTRGNHLRLGYGSNFELDPSAEKTWNVAYGTCYRSDDFGKECIATAKKIGSSTTQPIWVLFSGGIDSEVVVRSFLQCEVNFRVAIVQFRNNLNLHDIAHAVVTCQELGIDYKLLDLNLEEFWGSDYFWELAQISKSVSPQFITTMWAVEQLGGDYCVIGSGECYLVSSKTNKHQSPFKRFQSFYWQDRDEDWELWEKESVASLYRYFLHRGLDGCPGFFQYSPELIRAYFKDEVINRYLENSQPGKTTVDVKLPLYHKYFGIRGRKKFTGFEAVLSLDKKYRSQLIESFPTRNSVFLTPLKRIRQQFQL